jgi:hypothetical protein
MSFPSGTRSAWLSESFDFLMAATSSLGITAISVAAIADCEVGFGLLMVCG